MRSPRRCRALRRAVASSIVTAVALTGCAIEQAADDPFAAQIDARGTLEDDDASTSELTAAEVTDAAIDDVEDFWTRAFPEVYGEEFEPLAGGFIAYGPGSDPVPCGPGLPYREIAQNAFYCPSDDLIAWDEDELIEPLFQQFGGFTVGIVMAHEFGHAIQARAVSPRIPTVVLELQADCFAGAWTRDVREGNAESFKVTGDDLDASIAGFLQLRDGIGTSANDPNAHGTGFDRIGAFQDGLENGASRCATYEDDFPTVFEFGFLSQADFASGGNLPFDQVAELTVQDLEAYWELAFADLGEVWDPVDAVIAFDPDGRRPVTCGDEEFTPEEASFSAFYCVTDDTVQFDNVGLMPELYEIGDFAMGFEIARQYAFAAQVRLGNTQRGLEAELQADCFVGAYVASTIVGFGQPRGLQSSPGDLDEAIISFLAAPDDEEASAFDRVAAFRQGVLGAGDLEDCDP